jgi:micrococcal nuclease
VGTHIAGIVAAAVFAVAACGTSVPAPLGTVVPEGSVGSDAGPVTTIAPAASAGFEPTGPTEVATVVKIVDGDTIRVDRGYGSERVRYIGINAPEPDDPGGKEASQRNAALVKVGDEVVLESDVSDMDQFDRLLRYVWIHRGSTWTLVNLQLIEDGVARAVAYPPDIKYQKRFAAAQKEAKNLEVGVWGLLGGSTATPKPTPKPTKKPSGGGGSCHPSYVPCLPVTDDLDCAEVGSMGVAPVDVVGPDSYRLDGDNDGLGCE